jgi:hypothetical protein
MLEVFKPALNTRIEIGYNVLDAVTSGSASLSADIILEFLKTFSPHESTTTFKPIS